MSISAQGDEQLLESLLDRSHIRMLICFATMRTGSPVVDEDLEQEVTLRVLRAIRRGLQVKHPKAFVARIVSDAVVDFWRKKRRFESLDSIPQGLLSYQQSPESRLDDARSHEELHRCLNRLSSKTLRALQLFYFQESSVNDIAIALQFSRSAAKMTLLRGREEVRRMMETLADSI